METPEPSATRKTRADVERNRERLLTAAHDVFTGGHHASLEAVARAAGLGIGTLYRHFPSRQALYEAVYRREVDQLVALSERLADEPDAAQAVRRWLHAAVDMVATKKGMVASLALAADATSAISARASGRLIAALDTLLARGVASGGLRGDVGAEELFLALIGMCMLRDQPGWRDSVTKLADTMLDGLRRPA